MADKKQVRQVGYYLPPDVAEWIRTEALRRNISQGDLIAEAIRLLQSLEQKKNGEH